MNKSLRSKCGQKLVCNTKKSEILKRTIQKATEGNGDLAENKSQTKLQELHQVLPVRLQAN